MDTWCLVSKMTLSPSHALKLHARQQCVCKGNPMDGQMHKMPCAPRVPNTYAPDA